jgi:hypothetical protein
LCWWKHWRNSLSLPAVYGLDNAVHGGAEMVKHRRVLPNALLHPYECKFVSEFGENLAEYLFAIKNTTHVFDMKDIICYYCNDNKTIEIFVI